MSTDLESIVSANSLPKQHHFAMDWTLIDGWVSSMRARGLRRSTLRRRVTGLLSLQRYVATGPEAVTPEMIEGWLNTLPMLRTRHAYHSDATLFYRWANRRGHLTVNPIEDIAPPRVPQSVPRPLSMAESAALLALPVDRHLGLMLRLGLCAGLRVSEIAALRWEDVHLGEGVLVVRDGKGGKDRPVPLHPELLRALAPPLRTGPVILSSRGDAFTPHTISIRLGALMAAVGIKGSAHQLRHSFGTEAARVSNGNVVAVAHLMGHSDPETTMGYVALGANEGQSIVTSMWSPAPPSPEPEPAPPATFAAPARPVAYRPFPMRRCHR